MTYDNWKLASPYDSELYLARERWGDALDYPAVAVAAAEYLLVDTGCVEKRPIINALEDAFGHMEATDVGKIGAFLGCNAAEPSEQ